MVPSGDIEALTDRVIQVIDKKDEYEEMKKMGHHIYKTVYSEEVFMENVKRLFE